MNLIKNGSLMVFFLPSLLSGNLAPQQRLNKKEGTHGDKAQSTLKPEGAGDAKKQQILADSRHH